jgi:hypothetical protein
LQSKFYAKDLKATIKKQCWMVIKNGVAKKKRSTKPHSSSTTYNGDDRTKYQIGQRLLLCHETTYS